MTSNNPSSTTTSSTTATSSQQQQQQQQSGSSTLTTTQQAPVEVFPLRLTQPPRVTWQEGIVDNEHLGRKSSKRCCIFHKPRKFGESSSESESSDNDSDSNGTEDVNINQARDKKIARKKSQQEIPNFQRFHA